MHHTIEETPDNQNGSANAVAEDSTAMTIEYLRGRLHSERLVSKAARERANELAKKVDEREEQLKVVSLQRKKAEKATLDILALLENHGISEISDEYDSDSGPEDSHYCPNMDNGNSVKEEESSVSSKETEGSSGSKHERTPSTGRSLSWKSSKDSPRSCERRYFDPSIRKRSTSVQPASSSRHRLGKSCRQIKRREIRSILEESRHESKSPGDHASDIVDHLTHNGLESRPKELSKSSADDVEKAPLNPEILVSSEAEGQVSDSSVSVQKHTCDGEMKRALQHQAHLIGRYEAEEKAQREWEEKYMGNGYNMLDSCEPGNQSDVTEDRDVTEERVETKALVRYPTEVVASNNNCQKSEETICLGKGSSITHINSSKISANAATESSHNFKVNEVHCSRPAASEFAFPTVNKTPVLTEVTHQQNYVIDSPAQGSLSTPQHVSPYSHIVSSTDDCGNRCQAETRTNTRSKEYAIAPHEAPQRLAGVLDALHQAKRLLERNISPLPSTDPRSLGKAAETSERDVERMKMAVGSPAGLFRVPTDFQFESPGPQTILPRSGYSLHSNDYSQYLPHSNEPRPPSSNLDQFFTSIPASPESRVSSIKPWYITSSPSSSAFNTFSSNSSYPDLAPRQSSSELFTVQSPGRSPGVPPSGNTLFYNDHVLPNRYR